MVLKFFIKKSASSYFYFVTAMFSATILIASLMFLVGDYSNFKEDASYEIRDQNNNIRQKITDSINYTQQIMSYVGRQISIRDHKNLKVINELLMNYRTPKNSIMNWGLFAWVDHDNKIKVSSGVGILSNEIDLSDREYVLLAKENPETVHVGSPVIGKVSKFKIIPLGYGVINSHREHIGTVIAGLAIDNLESEINKVISGENVLFAIISDKGEIITKSSRIDAGQNKKIFESAIKKIKANPNQEIKSDFSLYQRLAGCDFECTNYGILTIYDQSSISHRNMMRITTFILIASLAISVAGFMLFAFYEHIVQPIEIISEYAEKIVHNNPDRAQPKFEVPELDNLSKILSEMDQEIWGKKR
jgi:hypothetical protein